VIFVERENVIFERERERDRERERESGWKLGSDLNM